MRASRAAASFGELLIEDRQTPRPILAHGLDECHAGTAALAPPAGKTDSLAILLPRRQVRHQLDAEDSARLENLVHGGEGRREVAFTQQRLQHVGLVGRAPTPRVCPANDKLLRARSVALFVKEAFCCIQGKRHSVVISQIPALVEYGVIGHIDLVRKFGLLIDTA